MCDDLKMKIEMNYEPFDLLRRKIDDKLTNIESIQHTQDKIEGDLSALGEKFKKNMQMIKSFIDEIQNFLNLLERRILQLESCIFSPLQEICNEESGQSFKQRKKKFKQKDILFFS